MRKQVISAALCAMLLFGAGGCKEECSAGKLEVWSYTAAERILRDKDYAASFKRAGRLDILACKNEEEGGQLILTPEKAVKNYTLVLSDLKSADGKTLKKESFSVYHQKYRNVTVASEGYSAGLGWYPDALLPMAKAEEYGENKISAGENQGVTVSCKVPAEQDAGKYTGTFLLRADGTEYEIPASVTVTDYTLSDEVTAKSCFLLGRHYLQFYGDSTMENYERYYEYLVEHRVMPMYLPALNYDISDYTARAHEYAAREDVSSFAVPYKETYSKTHKDIDVDWDFLEEMTKSLALKSIETGVNIVGKCYYYFGIIDEARMGGIEDRAARICNQAYLLVNRLADELAAAASVTGEIKDEVCASLRKIPCLETSEYTERMNNGGEGVRTWCPLFNYFDTATEREFYKSLGTETWWYGCIGPNNPYPTYQIDDALISSRIVSWMQKDYGLAGNLYWETVFWTRYRDEVREKTDVYEGDPMHFPGDNGDGYLVYPGDVYGIDGPVGSIRLESIRDGLEDYEMLAELEKRYAATGVDDTDLLQTLYSRLYAGARVTTTAGEFMRVRETLYGAAALCQGYDTYISDIRATGEKTVFEILAADGVALKAGGKLLSGAEAEKEGYKRYTVEVSLEGPSNALSLTAEKDGKSQTMRLDLGGKSTLLTTLDGNGALEAFSSDMAELSVADGTLEDDNMDTRVLKAVFGASTDKVQSLRFTAAGLSALPESDTLLFDLYNMDGDVGLTVYVSVSAKPVLIPVGAVTLKHGYQKVTLSDLGSLAWDTYGDVRYIAFHFGSKSDVARTVLIDNIVLRAREVTE